MREEECVHADLSITEPTFIDSIELLTETLSEPMKITISENIYQMIKDEFAYSERGEFQVKGFGMNTLYYMERELRKLIVVVFDIEKKSGCGSYLPDPLWF